ncbi:MAG: HD domain-containing protein [Archangium sp.]|nr:HD domain-containing protein [Archangium sp.]
MSRALFVLSDALDLVGVDDVLHGKRVAWLGRQLVGVLGEPEWQQDVHHASLVHDCGVSSTLLHSRLVEHVATVDGHSEVGARLLADFRPLAHLSEVVRHHHTPWAHLRDLDPRTAKLANLIFLADRVDVLQASAAPPDAASLRRLVNQRLLQPWAHLFAPDLVDAARQVLEDPQVVRALRSQARELLAEPERDGPCSLTPADARGLALLFAQTVDAKSAFTARHSNGVAALALHLADASGLSRGPREVLEIASLLHDLGKLRVPDEILEKPGALDARELATMRLHSSDSRLILDRIGGFEDIARLAGMHHELLDGSGYPDGLRGEEIPIEAQFITVADIFQALAQDRPYRKALAPKEILSILQAQVTTGRLDARLVSIIAMDVEFAWTLARVDEAPGSTPHRAVAGA